ncbi:MAG: PAS domain-containing sensor histidine kinase [Melioribacter sp.]|nr:PAS domain-containing sensor histidine kinase [Melioribacter sp.]
MKKLNKQSSIISAEGTIYDERLFPHRHVSRDQLYKIISEFSIDWIYWLDPHNKISYMSPSCKFITGYTKEEFLKEQSLLLKIISPEHLEKFIHHTREVLRGKIFCTQEFKIITKNGEERWINHACQAVYDDNNKYIGRYISNRDITDLKIACRNLENKEKQLSDIYNDVSLGYYQIFPDGKLNFVNDAFVKMLGYDNFEELLKNNLWEKIFINKEKRTLLKNFINSNSTIKNVESNILKKDGTILHVKETIKPIKDSRNKINYFEVIVQNTSEKKKAEESLLELENNKSKLEKLKAEFLATISHEIRTPVNIIVNLSQMLKAELDETKNDELIENAYIIESESKRIQRTINLILEMAQLTSETYEYKPELLNLNSDIKEIIEKYKPLTAKKGLDIIFTSKSTNPLIISDKHACQQIFSQIIDNAIKYTPEGRIEITLYDNENKIIVDITDTGIGIHEEYIPYLFSTFTQEDNSYSRMFEGTGLGLALVKKYCDLINSKINVKSKKGIGSTFTVEFDRI